MSDQSPKKVLVHSAELDELPYPESVPFKTNRAGKAVATLRTMGLLTGPDREVVPPAAATRDQLETFHTARYLDALDRAEHGHHSLDFLRMGIGSPDCPVFKGLNAYAALACGATLTAADLVASGEAAVAFNPSGGYHHAGPELAAGFCYINDVAIACGRLAERFDRVLYLDVDVHHGDGVQNAFYDRGDVMTISLHETGRFLFPGTGFEDEIGTGAGRGYAVNLPLPPETYDAAYLRAFDAVVPPLARAFDPDVIVFEIGMDGLSGDPLAHLSLTNNAHVEIIHRVLGFGRPVVATGGGGYHVENTARGWALAWTVLCGEDRSADLQVGLGGVMLETTDWQGGLRDRALPPTDVQRQFVDPDVDETIRKVRRNVFPFHGLSEDA